MRYDPIKSVLGNVVRRFPLFRVIFYKLLDLLFLRAWHVKRAVGRLLTQSPAAMVYDAGSGFGQYSYHMASTFPGIRIDAIDVKQEQIEDCRDFFSARGLKNVSFAVEDLTAITHRDRYDLVLSVDVMEHIPEDELVFRNFYQALKKGGRLLINTPSEFGGSDTHGDDDQSFIEEHARNGYGMAEMRSKLERAGFNVEWIRFTYGKWGMASWRIVIKLPILMVNITKLFFLLLPFYYIVALPVGLLLMSVDYFFENKRGAGLLVLAVKQ